MKPILQEKMTGCGIASVAAIAGVSYTLAQTAGASLGIFPSDPRLWSDTDHVRRLLAHFGCTTAPTEIPFASWEALPDLATLAIKWRLVRNTPYWHWVVFVRDAHGPVVYDSKQALRSNVRRDFSRIMPKWFIEGRTKNEVGS
ncbi:MAG: hypothetical protein Nkreftii_000935 [Candidatus Nitrospira kreftii]|uniref:Peptidase C39 domain-containing protein n=1 Tax=Candidatus Nitrospira kreftii TaxID=2652173 RepID=A0A7S8FC82_9BACT|nr:MAG: hypothetical protein Nkreftii_000935 [Candidatus Nitrospira kreftii]